MTHVDFEIRDRFSIDTSIPYPPRDKGTVFRCLFFFFYLKYEASSALIGVDSFFCTRYFLNIVNSSIFFSCYGRKLKMPLESSQSSTKPPIGIYSSQRTRNDYIAQNTISVLGSFDIKLFGRKLPAI